MFIDEIHFDGDSAGFLIRTDDIDHIDYVFSTYDLADKQWSATNGGYATLIVRRQSKRSIRRFAQLVDKATNECYAA